MNLIGECPVFRPKKAVEGLLRHLQKKWQKAVSQLGNAYELHLVGLLAGQPDSCLSWKSQGISSALTVCLLCSFCFHYVWMLHAGLRSRLAYTGPIWLGALAHVHHSFV